MSAVTTHVLDTSRGKPAVGVPVLLEVRAEDGTWRPIGRAATDSDGRAQMLPAGDHVARGTYRISFDTASYFLALNVEGFYPEVQIAFEVRDPSQHYHVPLLLSRYGYSTYRGS
ncbi:MAG TPA: hydroxyisourate hydrolase [Thermoanaerobaculia bacterium]|nr:hydroxyisourate hydrolase [Thermoanaerobaculia bacterium]